MSNIGPVTTLGASSGWIPSTVRVVLFAAFVLPSGCSTPRTMAGQPVPQAYYQTAYPTHDTSRELTRVFESVKRVDFTAEYRTYLFAESAGVTEAEVLAGGFESRADTVIRERETKSGTAIIIARLDRQVALLTANHVAEFRPIRIRFYDESDRVEAAPAPSRVASVSVLRSTRGILVPHPGRGGLEVVARDERNDLAVLGMVLGELSDTAQFHALTLGPGNPRRLSWGSFVYVAGFPAGYPMVTRGIVSNPDWDGRGSFITDGLWNEGISGGLILAVRGETGRLEAVGLARAGAAGRELRLQPDTAGTPFGTETRLYEGALYIESVLRIQYGITLPVSMTLVREFLEEHNARLRARFGQIRLLSSG